MLYVFCFFLFILYTRVESCGSNKNTMLYDANQCEEYLICDMDYCKCMNKNYTIGDIECQISNTSSCDDFEFCHRGFLKCVEDVASLSEKYDNYGSSFCITWKANLECELNIIRNDNKKNNLYLYTSCIRTTASKLLNSNLKCNFDAKFTGICTENTNYISLPRASTNTTYRVMPKNVLSTFSTILPKNSSKEISLKSFFMVFIIFFILFLHY
jgi:hypothetical protein